jgi:hypothetical protein
VREGREERATRGNSVCGVGREWGGAGGRGGSGFQLAGRDLLERYAGGLRSVSPVSWQKRMKVEGGREWTETRRGVGERRMRGRA